MSTLQRIYNKVVTHLASQGEPAWDPVREVCRYRLKRDDGTVLKCAAGILIPDGWYFLQLEEVPSVRGDFWKRVLRHNHEVEEHLLEDVMSLLRSLQAAHDSARSGEHLAAYLKATADLSGLDSRLVDTLQIAKTFKVKRQ